MSRSNKVSALQSIRNVSIYSNPQPAIFRIEDRWVFILFLFLKCCYFYISHFLALVVVVLTSYGLTQFLGRSRGSMVNDITDTFAAGINEVNLELKLNVVTEFRFSFNLRIQTY